VYIEGFKIPLGICI